jgi:hypothetical protein
LVCSDWFHSLGREEVAGSYFHEERQAVVTLDLKIVIVKLQA